MSKVYITSDWHIGHNGIASKFRTQFPSDDAHDDYVLGCARAVVGKNDVLIVVGDVTWCNAGIQKIKDAEFPCKMIMIAGNHDTLPTASYLRIFHSIHGVYMYKGFWITHMPVHPNELLGRQNIHGHCHRGGPWENNKEKDYFNAILEYNDYLPVNLQKIRKLMEERQ